MDSPVPTPTPTDDPTSSQRSSRRGSRPLITFVAGLLVVVVGVELGVRAVQSRLPEPQVYFSTAAQKFVHDMDTLKAHGIKSRVTFFGTSMVQRGIDGNKVESLLSWPNTSVHNVALPGSQTPLMQRWLLEEVVPRLHPKVIVWGVSSLEFNGGRIQHRIDDYNAARATRTGVLADLDRSLNNLAISKHRAALRDPFQLQLAVDGTAAKYTRNIPLSNRATWQSTFKPMSAANLAKNQKVEAAYARATQLLDFRVGQAELAAFSETISELQRRGIKVVIVVMPVPSGYLSVHPGGAKQFGDWQQLITTTATKLGANVIDQFVRALPDDSFRDVEHLETVPARDVFTPKLTTALTALPWWRTVFAT